MVVPSIIVLLHQKAINDLVELAMGALVKYNSPRSLGRNWAELLFDFMKLVIHLLCRKVRAAIDNDVDRGIKNGDQATVESIESGRSRIFIDKR